MISDKKKKGEGVYTLWPDLESFPGSRSSFKNVIVSVLCLYSMLLN